MLATTLALLSTGGIVGASIHGYFKGYPIVRFTVNGQEVHSDVPAVMLEGSVVVPLHAVAEALGAQVKWDPETYTAAITTPKSATPSPSQQQVEPSKQPPAPRSWYTVDELRAKGIWTLSQVKASRFDGAVVVGSGSIHQAISRHLRTGGGISARNVTDTAELARIAGGPSIFTYVPGDPVGALAAYWPLSPDEVNDALNRHGALAAFGEVDRQPRLLLAGKDAAHLELLVACAFTGTCPGLYRSSVSPWDDLVSPRPDWAKYAVVIDVRKPADNGTAVVYLEAPAARLQGGDEWQRRPSNLRATFHPADGTLAEAMPDYKNLQTGASGRLVYEIQPHFQPSGVRSAILADMAFLRMSAVLPEFVTETDSLIAVKWLLPSGWAVNAPWQLRDGWYVMRSRELAGAPTMVSLGPLSIREFTVEGDQFILAQLADSPSAAQEEMASFMQTSLRELIRRLGPPPTPYERRFSITLFNRGLVDGGTSGYRSLTTKNDRKIALHETIHWWLGVSFTSDVNTWHESLTEYLAARSMLEFGFWGQSEYESFFQKAGAVKSNYGRQRDARNLYGDDALAFMRDLDAYVREHSAGKSSLYDVVRHFHTHEASRLAGRTHLTYEETLDLIRRATGVDPTPFFRDRY